MNLENAKTLIFKAKITPKKVGQFVCVWKRGADGTTQPYSLEDQLETMEIEVEKEDKQGKFVFPKAVLVEQGIISVQGKGGKRGMRVYPPWDIADNAQAKKTQSWQLKYFKKG